MDIRLLPYYSFLNWFLVMLGLWVQIAIHFTSGLFIAGLMKSFNLMSYQVSILIASGFIIHALMQLFAGYLVGRFGPRRVQSVGAVVCAIGAWCLSHAVSFEAALMFRVFSSLLPDHLHRLSALAKGYRIPFISVPVK